MKRFWTALMATLLVLQVSAHEGMWLPHLIKTLNHQDMTEHGLQLTADELYSANGSSLKDASVIKSKCLLPSLLIALADIMEVLSFSRESMP